MNSMQPVTARFTTSYSEMRRAMAAISTAIPRVQMMRRLSWGALGIIALFVLTKVISFSFALTLLFVPLLVVMLLWLMPFSMAWMTLRKSPVWASEQFIDFSSRGIRSGGAGAESTVDWQAIMRTAEDREFLLFFTSDQIGHFIPKRVFTPVQLEEVTRLFAERAGKPGSEGDEWKSSRLPALVEVSFSIDPVESGRAGMAAARKDSSFWMVYVLMALLVLANAGPYVWTQYQRGGFSTINFGVILLALAPLLLLMFGLPIIVRWAARRQLRTGPSTQGTQHVGIADWGIFVSGPMYRGEIAWSSMMKASETPEFFLFFISKIQAFFIPKRLLTAAEVEQVRSLVSSGMGSKADVTREEL